MEGGKKPQTTAGKVRDSIKNFVGVGGKNKEEWQGKMDKWQRRSVAAHDDGKLLGKVDKSKQPMQHRVSNAGFGKPGALQQPGAKVKRPSAIKMGYDYFRDKIDDSKTKGERKKKAETETEAPRELGKGLVGELLKREYRKSRMINEVRMNMANLTTYRPYFTYWVTFVQVVIFIVTTSLYGLGPIGIGYRKVTGNVPKVHLTIEPTYYMQEQNLWIGPSPESLIHVGAKFSPCMRKDHNVETALTVDRELEKNTACCKYNDGSGCVQSAEKDCSICQENSSVPDKTNYKHLECELTGRPCCVGIKGECIITSDQHCKFLKGYFHPKAFLCSQVPCMDSVCGMIPFYTPGVPDQFGRLITCQFLHAGLLQLLISLVYQGFIMRDLEKLIGWLRMAIIYLVSGVVGSLASAIFLPYHVEAGPSGAQFGIAACLFVELIQNWYILLNPWCALLKLAAILLVLFVIGLLPMIDNYAHMFGFLYGFLLAFALMPHITFNLKDRRDKLIGVVVCLILALGLFIILIILFYVTPIHQCGVCQYFNCVPFTKDFCAGMEMKVDRRDVWYN